jgi:hypothetical protein
VVQRTSDVLGVNWRQRSRECGVETAQGARSYPLDHHEAAASRPQLATCGKECFRRDRTCFASVAPVFKPRVDAVVIGPEVEHAPTLEPEEALALNPRETSSRGTDLSVVFGPVDGADRYRPLATDDLDPWMLRLRMNVHEHPISSQRVVDLSQDVHDALER